ncbi:TIGR00153 family protein [candidate division WOR-3 bacterium]|uniref:TIGR00153 family protein n=1 Tax=candidate division WOR-3 bacterium TaxID=2052148 RepID=A0A660SNI2_UNCW3|nr:MAG: TIGR00153 family protein [candidate division WOR-3 bacterium]
MRFLIFKLFRRSPFDGLIKHAQKIKECIRVFRQAIEAYMEGDFDRFDDLTKAVSRLEHEADLIKANIRAHLPKGIFMPVDKAQFLMLLKEQDAILDFAEDALIWLSFKKSGIPDEIRKDFAEHLGKVLETVDALEVVINHIHEIITGLPKKERKELKDLVKEIHRKEWEADQIEMRLAKKLFSLDLDPLSIFHLSKAFDLIDQIANHTENAGDWVRAMMAR